MSYQTKGKSTCTECGAAAIARHLCRKHYNKARNTGQLELHSKISGDEAFDCRVKKSDGCWLWTGTKNHYGYGIFLLPGEKAVRAHRYSYERARGAIPDGLIVLHRCDTPACVNPDHLRVGTHNDNNKDTASKHRHNYGLKHWNGRLSDDAVAEIRASNAKNIELARKHGVAACHISRIRLMQKRTYLAGGV